MKPQKGYYSVIQYCPDLSRFEAANIGVLLFCPDSGFLKAVTSGNHQRIISFFGREGHDWKRIRAFKQGIEVRLQKERSAIRTVDDLQQFISMRANLIQMTDPRPMKVYEPEQDLADLFHKLVGDVAHRQRGKSLKKALAEKFAKAALEKKVVSDITVEVPVLKREVPFAFGFQNGRFNLMQPVSFQSSDPDSAIRSACKWAVEGRSLYEHRDPRLGAMQLVIVGQFRASDDPSQSVVRRVLGENEVKLYKFDEVPQLIDEIQRTGKEIEGTPLGMEIAAQ